MNNRFDQDAASWDAKAYRTKMAEEVRAAVLKEVTLLPEMDVLDFGCGTGLVSLPLAKEVASLTGLDNSEGMLTVFMDKSAAENLNNVKSLNLNLGEGDILSGSYDLILSSMALHHVKDVSAVINQLSSALSPGGYLCIADLDPDAGLFHADNAAAGVQHFGFERETMMGYYKTAGLSSVRAATATTMPRVGEDGVQRDFSIFLITGFK